MGKLDFELGVEKGLPDLLQVADERAVCAVVVAESLVLEKLSSLDLVPAIPAELLLDLGRLPHYGEKALVARFVVLVARGLLREVEDAQLSVPGQKEELRAGHAPDAVEIVEPAVRPFGPVFREHDDRVVLDEEDPLGPDLPPKRKPLALLDPLRLGGRSRPF